MNDQATSPTDNRVGLLKAVRELVVRAGLEQIDVDDVTLELLGMTGASFDESVDGGADALRVLATDIGWSIAALEGDVAVAARNRARLLAAAGDALGALQTWVDAATLAVAQGAIDSTHAGVDGAFDVSRDGIDAGVVADHLTRCAEIASNTGHLRTAEFWTQVAALRHAADDGDLAARALHHAWWSSDEEDSERLLRHASTVGGDASGWAARADAVLAFMNDRIDDFERHSERALSHARATRDQALEALALNGIACARSIVGDVTNAIAIQRQAIAIAHVVGDGRTRDGGTSNLVHMLQDDLRDAEAIAEVVRLRGSRELVSAPGRVAEAMAMHASLLHATGDIAASEELLAQIAEYGAQLAAEPLVHGYAILTRLAIGVDADASDDELDPLFSKLSSIAIATGYGMYAKHVVKLEAIRLFDADDAAAACALLGETEVVEHAVLDVELAIPLVRAALATADTAALDVAAEHIEGCACTARIVGIAGRELRAARALLAGDGGASLRDVADEWMRRGRPIEAGRALLAGAMSLRGTDCGEALANAAYELLAPVGAARPAAAARGLCGTADAGGQRLPELRDSLLFDGIAPEVRDELLRHELQVHRAAGSLLHEADDVVDTLWIVRSGRVRLYRETADERRLTVELIDPGSLLGEHSLLGIDHCGTIAECEEPVVLAALPIEHVARAMQRCPRLGSNLLALVGGRLDRSRQLAERVALWTVDRRIARCLIDLEERYGHPTLDGHRIINRAFTHFQLAELVNARRETVGETLKRLRSSGVIELRKRRIVILDRATLEQMVDAD